MFGQHRPQAAPRSASPISDFCASEQTDNLAGLYQKIQVLGTTPADVLAAKTSFMMPASWLLYSMSNDHSSKNVCRSVQAF